MAEHLEPWTEKTPERVPTRGLAEQVVRMRDEAAAAEPPVAPRKARRERGPFITYLRLPWSYGDRERTDIRRVLRCRLGRHEMRGGEQMQLAGEVIFLDRCCRWCGSADDRMGFARP